MPNNKKPLRADLDPVLRKAVMDTAKAKQLTPSSMAERLIEKGLEAYRQEAAAIAR